MRGTGGGVMESGNQLLAELDGLEALKDVRIAATNRPDISIQRTMIGRFDQCLVGPGRQGA